ncbi:MULTISPECIES: class I ribonucleotide reductase maintenance protein YfaE [Pseudoalteromonas]|jgi:ferredoxin|uniref:Ferredoxin n=1 Tax=Pseudoalteromonas rubra TaxID=43658 RepID=A0A0F4QS61_9GAMM|nr:MULTISPECIES: class I ribonucleotide reductase maintenance protein YfaE [Pseudoalteromonas]KJZ10090.1 ferredoxin [Pseudoalteromonas rubra]MCF2909307.1 class I ribonucleotide reductase maintenance protein YfaE [Pseudoalteromonas sp. DL2-H2.2]TMP36068.1 ferredoxin [Pseudoalteromonas rubra]
MTDRPVKKIFLDPEKEPLLHAAHSPSLLATLEANQVEVAYQCREGFCGACRAKLCRGKIAYNQEPLAFVRDGEILLCCSKPVTDVIIKLV